MQHQLKTMVVLSYMVSEGVSIALGWAEHSQDLLRFGFGHKYYYCLMKVEGKS